MANTLKIATACQSGKLPPAAVPAWTTELVLLGPVDEGRTGKVLLPTTTNELPGSRLTTVPPIVTPGAPAVNVVPSTTTIELDTTVIVTGGVMVGGLVMIVGLVPTNEVSVTSNRLTDVSTTGTGPIVVEVHITLDILTSVVVVGLTMVETTETVVVAAATVTVEVDVWVTQSSRL
jgi:hypothetical protein